MLMTIFLAIIGIGIISAFLKLCFGVGCLACKGAKAIGYIILGTIATMVIMAIIAAIIA